MRKQKIFKRGFGEEWRIYHDPYSLRGAGTWRWEHCILGFIVKTSEVGFSSPHDCYRDAIKHGLPRDSDTEFHKLPDVNIVGCGTDLTVMMIAGIVIYLIWSVWLKQ